MNMEVLADADSVAHEAAAIIAQEARLSVSARGRFVLAVNGDATSLLMLRALAYEQVVWERLHIVQVGECVAPIGDPCRDFSRLRESLLGRAPLRPQQIHAMPVEAKDLKVSAARYALSLHRLAGSPPVLDLVLPGLGLDGHTASLMPGDPVLTVTDRDVATTGIYQEKRWMTMTYPILNRSRLVLWLVTGREKAEMLNRLRERDESIPAGRVRGGASLILADSAAASPVAFGQQKAG